MASISVPPRSPSLPARGNGVPARFGPAGPLNGRIAAPGDKAISHRALILAGLAVGESRITGLSDSADVRATAGAMAALGADIARDDDARDDGGAWRVHGAGVGTLLQPRGAIDLGNSGTSARLLMGLVATHPIQCCFTGDASLSARPMARVIDPLRDMGADITAAPGGRLPAVVRGLMPAVPLSYRLPLPSAQVKSALLLAGLNTPGTTRVIEPVPTRDHSEILLARFGADIRVERLDGRPDERAQGAGREIILTGETELTPAAVAVPGDPSSAAFPLLAALIVPGSAVTVTGVCVNPRRAGLLRVLEAMGADLSIANPRDLDGEPVADITARHGRLEGVGIAPALAPDMIDEFPALFVAAAFAHGRTVAEGLGELRHKESDRLAAMAAALSAIGARVEMLEATSGGGLAITGSGGAPLAGGATVRTHGDHRVAMSLAIAARHCRAPVAIDDTACIATSYPGFFADLAALSAGKDGGADGGRGDGR